jgi:hypothetical protein
VFPISTATDTLRQPIKTENLGRIALNPAIAITPDGATAYVLALRSRHPASSVVPISTATDTTLKPVKVGYQAVAMAVRR